MYKIVNFLRENFFSTKWTHFFWLTLIVTCLFTAQNMNKSKMKICNSYTFIHFWVISENAVKLEFEVPFLGLWMFCCLVGLLQNMRSLRSEQRRLRKWNIQNKTISCSHLITTTIFNCILIWEACIPVFEYS